jgi:archaemetzincin
MSARYGLVLALLLCACDDARPSGRSRVEYVEPVEPGQAEPKPEVAATRAPQVEPELPEPNVEPKKRSRGTVVIVPLRSFPDDLLDTVERALRAELGVEVVRHATVELPDEAYYAPRSRYRAEKLLDYLDGFASELEPLADEAGGDVKILGVTEVDISTTGDDVPDWGIFGLGSCPGRTAVISSKRLQRRPKNREHVRFRVANVAVHEIGHTFGLPHCNEHAVECVMIDAEGGIENTDTSSGKLGPVCSTMLDGLTMFGR